MSGDQAGGAGPAQDDAAGLLALARLREMAECPGAIADAAALVLALLTGEIDAQADALASPQDLDTARAQMLALARLAAWNTVAMYRGDVQAAAHLMAMTAAKAAQKAQE